MNDVADENMPQGRIGFFDRLESFYLAAVRVLALTGATLLLLLAAWFIVSGLYKVSRDVALVEEAAAAVTADDVVAINMNFANPASANAGANKGDAAAKTYYTDFVSRYQAIYQAKFAPFHQATDKPLSRDAFDQRYVQSSDRIERVRDGSTSLDADKADLETLISTMQGAAAAKATTDRLAAYKTAKRQQISRTIRSTRTETYCSEYGYYINACLDYDVREVPESRTVTESRLPKGVISPPDLFQAYQDRFLSLLAERREQSASKAAAERAEIELGNAVGASRLWTALYVFGAFVSLMFLFLLIAIERHQRRIARTLPTPSTS